MTPRYGDMWSQYTDDPKTLFLFCANGVINSKGELVMGKGSAAQAKAMFPGLAKKLGRMVERAGWYGLYGVVVPDDVNIGAFQTKKHWRESSQVSYISYALASLELECYHRYDTIHLPYPGIGHGDLAMEQVEPLIVGLPDMVHVWTYK